MSELRRTTVFLEPDLHRALRLRAAESGRSISELVNEAVRLSFGEDVEDLAAFEERLAEGTVPYEEFVRSLS